MNYHEFLDHVHAQPGPDSEEEALTATKATLGTLGERILPGLRENVAAQLDQDLVPFLTAYPGAESDRVEPFSLRDFYRRVADRADIAEEDAVMHARAVMTTLAQALTHGQWEDLLSQLSDEYQGLTGEYPDTR
jgi:uncharacterized protein (DUF2267 family)